eukprot:TRINITY_DN4875_c0_g2_i1.p1 TRINITY_DN4875_c0_g2~~TRINITY_DN4875_c0_g2_i1.p1  ORF type:complete len:435 (+),score=38.83 TRINITY_DN4875_c0_g2_i1:1023-2327(+)
MIAIFTKQASRKEKERVFCLLQERIQVLQDNLAQKPALVAHVAKTFHNRLPYESIFRNIHKLLLDTATTEYLFCNRFFDDDSVFHEIFVPILQVVEGSLNAHTHEVYDILTILMMIRLNFQNHLIMNKRRVPGIDSYLDRVNILLWPKFKQILDLHQNSVAKLGAERALFSNDPSSALQVSRNYANLVSSILTLNAEYQDPDINASLDRLKTAVMNLLTRISGLYRDRRQGVICLIHNYKAMVSILQQARSNVIKTLPATAGTPTHQQSAIGDKGEELLKELSNQLNHSISLYIEDQLGHHFATLIEFVKKGEQNSKSSNWNEGTPIPGHSPQQALPVINDFKNRWERACQVLNSEIQLHFGKQSDQQAGPQQSPSEVNNVANEVLKSCFTQLMLYYTRMQELLKKQGPEGNAVLKEAVSTAAIVYEIKQYTKM